MAESLQEEDFRGSSGRLDFNRDRQKLLVVGFFFFGLFLLALGGGLFFFKGGSTSDDIQIISASQGLALRGYEIVVHLDGAVVAPGVYRLSSDLRVGDAISAAGGLAPDADSSRINLAAKVSDGQKIYVFAVGESTSITSGQGTTSTTGSSVAGESINQLVNINTASESELDKLPGVGPVTAQKVISSRPYSALEDLLTKKAVNRSTYEKIKDLITVY